MGQQVTRTNRSLASTGCGGCITIVIILILIGAYIYFSGKADEKNAEELSIAEKTEAVEAEKNVKKPEEQALQLPETQIEAKPVKAVEEKTVIAPKVNNFF